MTVVFSSWPPTRPMLAMFPHQFTVRVSQDKRVATDIIDGASPEGRLQRAIAELQFSAGPGLWWRPVS